MATEPATSTGSGLRAAWQKFRHAVSEDHAQILRTQAKYGSKVESDASIPALMAQKIGFQMMTAYRVMRFFVDAGIPVAPKLASRAIRHLYGSDIHWDAEFAPGVIIVHGMGLAISHAARVGPGVILNQNVTIGMGVDPETRAGGAPTIEANVHVGAGAMLCGPITIGTGSKIMPGCVVMTSVPPNSLVQACQPTVRSRAKQSTQSQDPNTSEPVA